MQTIFQLRYELVAFLPVGIAVVYLAAKIFRLIYLNAGLEKSLCPNCGTMKIKKSSPRPMLDLPYRIFGLRPYRCRVCEIRFFAPPARAEFRTDSRHAHPAGVRQ